MRIWPELRKVLKYGRRIDSQTIRKESEVAVIFVFCLFAGILLLTCALLFYGK